MQLIYRGTTFNYVPSQSATCHPFQQAHQPGKICSLMYRGVAYQINPNAKTENISEKPKAYELRYRGVRYYVNRNEQGDVTGAPPTAIDSKHKTAVPAHSTNQQIGECFF